MNKIKFYKNSIAIAIDAKGILFSLDFTNFRSKLINRIQAFHLLKPETYLNINWDYLKYLLIVLIAYFIFAPNAMLNNQSESIEASNTFSSQQNNLVEANRSESDLLEDSQAELINKQISKIAKRFFGQIKKIINENDIENDQSLKSQIITMIDNAEKSFIYISLVPVEILEELESIKAKLFLEEKIDEKNFLVENEFKKKDFDEISKFSYTNSLMSESTMNQSDSDDYNFFNFEKSKERIFIKNKLKTTKQIFEERCIFITDENYYYNNNNNN